MDFSPELRERVAAGEITLTYRLWSRRKVKAGGSYRSTGLVGQVVVDSIEAVPFSSVTKADLKRCGEPDLESLRRRTAHAGPVDDDTVVYRIEFHLA